MRYIAPYVKDKFTDSAVVVMDEKAGYVIPLLSGHLGGAVELSNQLAVWTGAVPVQTTATDVQGKFAVDVLQRRITCILQSAKQRSRYQPQCWMESRSVCGSVKDWYLNRKIFRKAV